MAAGAEVEVAARAEAGTVVGTVAGAVVRDTKAKPPNLEPAMEEQEPSARRRRWKMQAPWRSIIMACLFPLPPPPPPPLLLL